jgi:hypothetical protein
VAPHRWPRGPAPATPRVVLCAGYLQGADREDELVKEGKEGRKR